MSATSKEHDDILHNSVAVSFAPDGRLWRVVPTKDNVFVDYSDDFGKNYTGKVKINPTEQKISAWQENPPTIAISRSGRIHVLYYANEQQKTTTFYSFSSDNGKTFSQPSLVSDHARTAKHYMAKMLLDDNNNLYLFWHDTRSDSHHQSSNDGLALYYTVTSPDKLQFINQFVSNDICSCCRTAVALGANGLPVLLARMVLPNNIRDHALLRMSANKQWSSPQQVTTDNWQIDACPEHGPALAIDKQNRSHFAWFTLGDKRQGIYYAHSDDDGKTVSEPLAIGDKAKLAGHPDVITLNNQVVLTWLQFDGKKNTVHVKTSKNRGETWEPEQVLFTSSSETNYPALISNGETIFLSVANKEQGHQIITVPVL